MKQQQGYNNSSNQYRKSRQFKQETQKQNKHEQSFKSQKLQDALQSQIAQEQVFLSELQRKDDFKKKSSRLIQPNSNLQQPSQNLLSKFNSEQTNCNAHFLLGQSISKKTQIVSISQIKKYQEKAKNKKQGFKFNDKFDLKLKVNDVSSPKNDKSLKKSLSSSKIARQKYQNLQQKQKLTNNKTNEQQNQLRQNRNSLDVQSVISSNQKILHRQSSNKKLISYNNSYTLYPMTVPFCYENINTTINNLQYFDVQSNASKQQFSGSRKKINQLNQQKKSLKKNKTQQNKLLKQLSSSKYFIDVPLDLNEFNYQLDIEVILQKNRGFQIYFVSPQRSFDGIFFEDVMHYKYEMVKLPPNMLRLRVYLLIQNQVQQKIKRKLSQKDQEARSSQMNASTQKQWKVWKQIQLPIMSQQKYDNQISKKIKITILNIDLNCVSIRINNMLDFNLKLSHPQVPVGYYCLSKDFNGVQFTKLSLFGKQKIKISQDLLGDGCQGKCQLI